MWVSFKYLGALLAGVAVDNLAARRRHVLLVERVQRVSGGGEGGERLKELAAKILTDKKGGK